jgi:hypothetical protein
MRQSMNICLRTAAAAAVVSLGSAACGGGSKSGGVASLSGASHGSATTTTLPKGTPTQLLDEWASCMRHNGDPNQSDPVIDSNGVIHITASGDPGSFRTSQGACQPYLTAAQTALGGRQATQKPSYSKLLAFSKCMRSHGIPDFPDPNPGGGLSIQATPGSDLAPNNPTFQSASKTCAKATGVAGFGATPSRGSVEITGSGPGPGASGGAGGKTVSGGA